MRNYEFVSLFLSCAWDTMRVHVILCVCVFCFRLYECVLQFLNIFVNVCFKESEFLLFEPLKNCMHGSYYILWWDIMCVYVCLGWVVIKCVWICLTSLQTLMSVCWWVCLFQSVSHNFQEKTGKFLCQRSNRSTFLMLLRNNFSVCWK